MRKVTCLALALLLCASLAMPAFAAFTPSVSVKETPEINTLTDEKGETIVDEQERKAIATFVIPGEEEEDPVEAKTYVFEGSLIVTSVAEANAETDEKDEPTDETEDQTEEDEDEASDEETAVLSERQQEIQEELKEIYIMLEEGEMEIPYEEYDLEAEKIVIRDLFDLSWHPANEDGLYDSTFEELMDLEECELHIDFDLGVEEDAVVHVFTYKDHTPDDDSDEKTWAPIVSVENNGDGTVTCVFDHLCPVAVCIETEEENN